ncbi:PAQR family membrane homeostasis protein TrhA [Roseivirga sp.]|uniref:PAQR family membrane homeostasis protein TrhA n=1 Tax=Roseivirga sp. TaxID=1964215 RepID=UPI002B27A445|nr:hemolysin III family protein [Roseivirga sp.]
MKNKGEAYSPEEELANAWTHGIAALLAIIGTALLLLKTPADATEKQVGFLVFGLSMVLLYAASTAYHSVKSQQRKSLYKKLDHIAIYVLIAGTFTPFCWVVLREEALGINVLIAVWAIAFVGTIFKIFFTGKLEALSLISYLGMGWLGFTLFSRLSELISPDAVNLLLYGGLCYTAGVIFYLMRKLKYHHAIWHLFVMGGTAFHFAAVYLYVLPFGN